MDLKAVLALHNEVRKLTDDEWVELVVRSLDDPLIDGLEMPGFPEADEVRGSMFGRVPDVAGLNEAASYYRIVKGLAQARGLVLGRGTRVLDAGCGWGRITRFFIKDVAPRNLFGADVDGRLIRVCKRTLPARQFTRLDPSGVLPFDDGAFDLVVSNSVLSHLDEAAHGAAIREWARVLRPGGLLVSTFLSEVVFLRAMDRKKRGLTNLLERCEYVDTAPDRLRVEGFVWMSTGRVDTRAAYGLAFARNTWIRARWPAAGIDVLDIALFDAFSQAFAVGRKPL